MTTTQLTRIGIVASLTLALPCYAAAAIAAPERPSLVVLTDYVKDPDEKQTKEAICNEFAARMDWCVHPPANANHPPIVQVDGDTTSNVLRLRRRL